MSRPPFVLNTSEPSEETLEIARTELRETPEVVAKAIEELRELLRNDDKIYFRDDDNFLKIYLRPCKYYAKSAYELMKRIAEFKEKNSEILTDLMPTDEKEAFTQHNAVNVLSRLDQKGRRVLIVNCGGSWDPSKVSTDQVFRLFYLIHQAAMLEPETQVRGCVVIMDFKGLTMKQAKAFTPAFSYRLLTFIQEAMPLRLKEVHMVKQPFIFNIIWQLFKPFIKQKLGARIFFHGNDMKSLHKHLSPSCLPSDYGGEYPAIDYTGADWYPCIVEYEDHFREMNKYGLRKLK